MLDHEHRSSGRKDVSKRIVPLDLLSALSDAPEIKRHSPSLLILNDLRGAY